jgi:hypothetical protein
VKEDPNRELCRAVGRGDTNWRPSRTLKKRRAEVHRFYEKCLDVAGWHHSEWPYVKRYRWAARLAFKQERARRARAAHQAG